MNQPSLKMSLSSIQTLKQNLLCHKPTTNTWLNDEDKLLFTFVRTNGIDKWEKCSLLFNNKTSSMCKERYYTLAKRKILLCKKCQNIIKERIKKKMLQKYYQLKFNQLKFNQLFNQTILENDENIILS
jgi:hypothetical protein